MAKWYVYVLRSLKDRGYYIGYTSNLERRIEFHNAGRQRSTRHRRPWRLVYYEEFSSRSEAIRREKQLKAYKGGEAFKRLIGA
ncbi:MAG: GIY-YIG nuclease family protein [Thermotogae bacterium]|nr:GIY-YIG nuclease family protein [Thermotogota bacterium]